MIARSYRRVPLGRYRAAGNVRALAGADAPVDPDAVPRAGGVRDHRARGDDVALVRDGLRARGVVRRGGPFPRARPGRAAAAHRGGGVQAGAGDTRGDPLDRVRGRARGERGRVRGRQDDEQDAGLRGLYRRGQRRRERTR